MRKHRFAVYAVMTATVLFSAMAGTFVSALANSAEVKHTTVNGNPATPGNAPQIQATLLRYRNRIGYRERDGNGNRRQY